MIDSSAVRRLSCYAVLNMGFSGENYLLPHLRLVLSLIASKGLKSIDAKDLVNLFRNEYQYTIDFFPMRSILSLAVSQGYLMKIRNDRHFRPTDKLAEFASVNAEIGQSEQELHELATAFQQFAAKIGVIYSVEDANLIIATYISTQKLSHS